MNRPSPEQALARVKYSADNILTSMGSLQMHASESDLTSMMDHVVSEVLQLSADVHALIVLELRRHEE